MSTTVARRVLKGWLLIISVFGLSTWLGQSAKSQDAGSLPRADGYRGIWYANQPSGDQYRYKYSGGFATYPQQHMPIAVYAEEAEKTFFVYGGRSESENRLLIMVSYYDHATDTVPRPVILLDKKTTDAHDNPTLTIDRDGYLWVFSNAHGTARSAFIHRSTRPFEIDRFELVAETNFSYGQPWYHDDFGFLLLHTRYQGGRSLYQMMSQDGVDWTNPARLARMELGHYQVSWLGVDQIATAFNMHPEPVGLNARTNLYYVESRDFGRTWQSSLGELVETPMTLTDHPTLVHDYQDESLLVYLKDLQFDSEGNPIILFLTSCGFEAGPKNNPRTWRTAHWRGDQWAIRTVTTSDHNYDHGSIYILSANRWRLIAPTDPGPQPCGAGGEVVIWESLDQGLTWSQLKQVTRESQRNHTYVRRPLNYHPEFAALWADGNPLEPSESYLYITDLNGERVWRLPAMMDSKANRNNDLR